MNENTAEWKHHWHPNSLLRHDVLPYWKAMTSISNFPKMHKVKERKRKSRITRDVRCIFFEIYLENMCTGQFFVFQWVPAMKCTHLLQNNDCLSSLSYYLNGRIMMTRWSRGCEIGCTNLQLCWLLEILFTMKNEVEVKSSRGLKSRMWMYLFVKRIT